MANFGAEIPTKHFFQKLSNLAIFFSEFISAIIIFNIIQSMGTSQKYKLLFYQRRAESYTQQPIQTLH